MNRSNSYEVIGDSVDGFTEVSGLRSSSQQANESVPMPRTVKYESTELPTRNIVWYDSAALLSYGWLLPLRGSVFQWKIIGICSAQLVLSTVLATMKCGGDNQYKCIPLPDNMTALTLLTITSFLVGLFSNNLLQRWWSIRVALGNVMNKSKALTVAVVSVVAVSVRHCSPDVKEQALGIVLTVKRYLALGHALIYKRANGNCSTADLISRGLLTTTESSRLCQHELPTDSDAERLLSPFQAYSWVALTLERAAAAGLLGPAPGSSGNHLNSMFADLSAIQSAAADADMYVRVQLPYPFVQMTVVIVLVSAGIIGQGFLLEDSSYVVTGYVTSFLLTFVLLGILHMYNMLSNPLGEDVADFPVSTYMRCEEEEVERLVMGIWTASASTGSNGILPDITITPDVLKRGREGS